MKLIYFIVLLVIINLIKSNLMKTKGNFAKIDSTNHADSFAYAINIGGTGAEADSTSVAVNTARIDQRM
jgi:hypothetical protein